VGGWVRWRGGKWDGVGVVLGLLRRGAEEKGKEEWFGGLGGGGGVGGCGVCWKRGGDGEGAGSGERGGCSGSCSGGWGWTRESNVTAISWLQPRKSNYVRMASGARISLQLPPLAGLEVFKKRRERVPVYVLFACLLLICDTE